MRLVQAFCDACRRGDETKAKSIVEMDPRVHNKQMEGGYTGLMCALCVGLGHRRSLIGWLLSMPDLDTSLSNDERWGWTALHFAGDDIGQRSTDIDIFIRLVRVSTISTLNMKDRRGHTALDIAVRGYWNSSGLGLTSATLYLGWLGGHKIKSTYPFTRRPFYHIALPLCQGRGPFEDDSSDECQERNRRYRKITMQTWTQWQHICQAMFWAIAANVSDHDLRLLSLQLLQDEKDEMDKERLRALARLFNRHNVCRMWGDLSSLRNLAWEKAWLSCPALHPDHRPDVVLPDFTPALFRKTVRHCYNNTRQYCCIVL